MSSFDYKSHTATDFDADEARMFSCAARDKIGDLCALVISAASYQLFLLNYKFCSCVDCRYGFSYPSREKNPPSGRLVLVSFW